MTATMKRTTPAVQVFQVYIKAAPEAIWTAITDPTWSVRYGYRCPVEYDLRPGGRFRGVANQEMQEHGAPATIIDGEVLEADPPRKLVQTWRVKWSPDLEAEGFTRLTYEIEPDINGIAKLTVTHELEGAPGVAKQVAGGGRLDQGGGGWPWILSDLKTLLEKGSSM